MATRRSQRKRSLRRRQRQRRTRRAHRRTIHRLRGGADYAEEIIGLLTSLDNWEDVLTFFQSMDSPAWHGQYPMVKDDTYYLVIHNGDHDERDQQKLMLITLTKTGDSFTSASIELMDDKKLSQVRSQIPEDATQYDNYGSDEYKGIRDASLALFEIGA